MKIPRKAYTLAWLFAMKSRLVCVSDLNGFYHMDNQIEKNTIYTRATCSSITLHKLF